MKQIAAHVGPAYSCAWHLEQEHRIVSAGRDKMIKVERETERHFSYYTTIQVHDIQTARAKEMNVINALFSVARVRWRPQHRNHLSRYKSLTCKSCDLTIILVVLIYWTILLLYGILDDHSYNMLHSLNILMMSQVCHVT